MRCAEWVRDLGLGLRSAPGRTALVLIPLTLGHLALALLLAISDGIRQQARALLEEFGPAHWLLVPAEAERAGQPPALTRAVHRRLAAELPGAVVTGWRRWEVDAQAGERVHLLAVDEAWSRARRWTLAAGRPLDGVDIMNRLRHAVISSALAERWSVGVGSVIQLGHMDFRVVGIWRSAEKGSAEGDSATPWAPGLHDIWVPWTAAPSALTTPSEPDDRLDAILVKWPREVSGPLVRERLQQRLGDPQSRAGPVHIIGPEQVIERLGRTRRGFDWGLGGVTGLSLLLGATVLAGLLSSQVRERVGEIGLRRALGATPRDIAMLFISEGILIAAVAAIVGAGLAAILLSTPLAHPWPARLSWRVVIIPMLSAPLVGWLASGIPARAASRLEPAEALRAE